MGRALVVLPSENPTRSGGCRRPGCMFGQTKANGDRSAHVDVRASAGLPGEEVAGVLGSTRRAFVGADTQCCTETRADRLVRVAADTEGSEFKNKARCRSLPRPAPDRGRLRDGATPPHGPFEPVGVAAVVGGRIVGSGSGESWGRRRRSSSSRTSLRQDSKCSSFRSSGVRRTPQRCPS